MPGSATRFFLTVIALAASFGVRSTARAEPPPAWRNQPLLQPSATGRELAPASARVWGLPYVADEAYAGPWASSPLAPTLPYSAPPRAFVTAFEQPNHARGPNEAAQPSDANARSAERVLSRLGPVSMLMSVLVPAIMTSSGARLANNDRTPRLGFAKLGRGYGVVLTGCFF